MDDIVLTKEEIAAINAHLAEECGYEDGDRKEVARKPLDKEATKQAYIEWLNSLQPPQAGQRQSYCFEPLVDRYGDCVRVWVTGRETMPQFAISDDAYAVSLLKENNINIATTALLETISLNTPYYGVRLFPTDELAFFADKYEFAKAVHYLLCSIVGVLEIVDRELNKRTGIKKCGVSIKAYQLRDWYEEAYDIAPDPNAIA